MLHSQPAHVNAWGSWEEASLGLPQKQLKEENKHLLTQEHWQDLLNPHLFLLETPEDRKRQCKGRHEAVPRVQLKAARGFELVREGLGSWSQSSPRQLWDLRPDL